MTTPIKGQLVDRNGRESIPIRGVALSMEEFMEGPAGHAKINQGVVSQFGADKDARMSQKPRWYGGVSSQAQWDKIVEDGWAEGTEKVSKCREALLSVPELATLDVAPRQRKRRWMDDGDDIDYDRMRNGELDTMWSGFTRTRAGVLPTISIVYSFGGHCGRDAEQLSWAGACALALCDIFEDAGYSVELTSLCLSRHGWGGDPKRTGGVQAVRVKDSDQPLNLGSLATICCHPAAFRVTNFKWIVADPKVKVDGGLGQCLDASNFDLEASGIPLEGTPLVLPQVYSMKQAVESVVAVLREGRALVGAEAFDNFEGHTQIEGGH